MDEALARILDYHRTTKHDFRRFARGPERLHWASQPDPFRRYHGAPLRPLPREDGPEEPRCDASLRLRRPPPAAPDAAALGRLLHHSLAVSAWKQLGDERWALRCNPSSGNLHPTEGHLVAGPVPGLAPHPFVAHYAPREHGLEMRAELPAAVWSALAAGWPAGTCFLGLTSIHFRESWKYGERAYRYCQLDVGHAVAAVSLAAAGLGWRCRLLDGWGRDALGALLGVGGGGDGDAEPEEPEVLLALVPGEPPDPVPEPPFTAREPLAGIRWRGEPNRLSPGRDRWHLVAEAAAAARKPPTPSGASPALPDPAPAAAAGKPRSLHRLIRGRRSAVAMDRRVRLPRDEFWRMLDAVRPRRDAPPWDALPWPPRVDLVLFVHRVEGLTPGLYLLSRRGGRRREPALALRPEFARQRPEGCPHGLPLVRLAEGGLEDEARAVSCGQDIAADGCFSLGMLAAFRPELARRGAWLYPRLFWECGAVGQVLYLAAEAAGVRGTGIGCFFDDAVHRLLGLAGDDFQSLYHFTVGAPLGDARLTSLPAYPAPDANR